MILDDGGCVLNGEHVSGLLNLVAFSAALSLGYFSLDRFDREFEDTMKVGSPQYQSNLEKLYQELDELRELYTNITRILEALFINNRIPMFVFPAMAYYLRHRLDVYVMAFIAVFSMGAFFIMSIATVTKIAWIDNEGAGLFLAYILSFMIMLSVLNVGLLYRLNASTENVERRENLVKRLNQLLSVDPPVDSA